jgi:hypothetical protein
MKNNKNKLNEEIINMQYNAGIISEQEYKTKKFELWRQDLKDFIKFAKQLTKK